MEETASTSQPGFMNVEPVDQHRWLRRLLGEWIVESASPAPPGDQSGPWNERGRAVGDLWVRLEGEGTMPDGKPGHTIMTLGFDPERDRFVGIFIGSMMTHLWIYEGELDAAGNTLTLRTEGPNMESGQMTRYEDVIEIEGEDRRALRSRMLTSDGTWKEIMLVHYRRTAAGSS